jgi:hypothetical protein
MIRLRGERGAALEAANVNGEIPLALALAPPPPLKG